MPYRRRYRPAVRRRRYPRGYPRRAPTYGQIGRKVYSDVMWLKKKIQKLNVEVKHHDVSTGASIPGHATGLNPVSLTAIAQGDTSETRDGNSIKCVGLDLRFLLKQNATTATDQQLRITVVKLKRAGIASLTSEEIFETPASSPMAYRNIDKSYPIQVLRDMFVKLNTDDNDLKTVKMHIPLKHHIKYDDNTSTSDQYGGIGFIIWSSEFSFPGTYTVLSRLRYVDN